MKINNLFKVSLMMTAVAIMGTSCNMSEMKEKRKEHREEMKEEQKEDSQKKATEKNNKETLSPVQTGTTPD